MDARGWLAVHVLVYASFAIGCATLRSSRRVIFLYVYLAMVLVVGGLLGAVYALPLSDSVSISAGSLAYGGFMFASLLLVIVGRDVQVVRTTVWIVLGVNAFKLVLFALAARAAVSPALVNPFEVSPQVFTLSVRVVVLGGALIVAELLLLLLVLERLKARTGSGVGQYLLHVLMFVVVLGLDGLLFPFVVLPWSEAAPAMAWAGLQAKLVLGGAYAVPLVAFLLLSRRRLARYRATPLRLQELFVAPQDDLVREIERQDEELAAHQTRSHELVAHSTDLIFVTDEQGVISFANPAAAALLGVSDREAVGLAGFDVLHAPDLVNIQRLFQEVAAEPGRVSLPVRIRVRHADGSPRVLEVVWNNQLHNPAIRGVVINVRDVTDRVVYEQLLDTHRSILTKIAVGDPLPECLRAVAGVVQEQWPDAVVVTYAVLGDDEAGMARALLHIGPATVTTESQRRPGPVRIEDLPPPAREAASTLQAAAGTVQPPDLAADPLLAALAGADPRCVQVLPLLGRGRAGLTGLLCVYLPAAAQVGEQGCAALTTAAALTRIALERQADVDRLLHLALHDELTGLPNRVLFLDRLDRALERERPERFVAVLVCDLDDFKLVNDTLGHGAGDDLLTVVGRRLSTLVAPGDTVARLGGDEFVLLCSALPGQQQALAMAERVLSTVRQTVPLGESSRTGTASVGVALAGRRGCAPEVLLAQADAAMYRAKAAGRNRVAVYDEQAHGALRERFEVERALARAVPDDQLVLHYQPQLDVRTGQAVAVEALVRWRRPGHGLVPPAAFIPIAEQTGLVVPVGTWVLNEACRQASRWSRAGHRLSMSVNVSARQLTQPDIAVLVQQALQDSGLDPQLLCLEITETAIMEDAHHLAGALEQLSALGVQISIDDFGTGYSSLLYLKRLRVHELKIDMEFVQGLGADAEDTAIVEAIISLAAALELTTVAEGVETAAQRDLLTALGCTRMQGFLLARPTEAAQLTPWLVAHRASSRRVPSG